MQHTPDSPSSTDWYGVPNTARPAVPSRLRRKSPKPPSINLDDCKPILSTTFTNSSTGSSSSGSTAFVFTSSRTTRAFHHQPDLSQPASPVSASSISSASAQRSRPMLSPSQLARHSEGAVDTRNMLGPNMRAAGFVHLSQSLAPENHAKLHGTAFPTSTSPPLTPGSAMGMQTPTDPPPFPPIMFVNPSVVGSTPMWDYQRSQHFSINGQQAGPYARERESKQIADNNGARTHPPGSTAGHPPAPIISSTRSSTRSSSTFPSTTVSSATLVSSSDSLSGSSSSYSLEAALRGKGRVVDRDFGLNEYPFPRTFSASSRIPSGAPAGPLQTQPPSRTTSSATKPIPIPIPIGHASSDSSSANSTSSRHSHRIDKTSDKTKEKPREKDRDREKKDKDRERERARERVKAKDASRDKKVPVETPRRAQPRFDLSLTELCETSPFAWTTPSDNFMPVTHGSRCASSSASGTGSASGTAVSLSSSASGRAKDKQRARELVAAIAEKPKEGHAESKGSRERRKAQEKEFAEREELPKDASRTHRREKPSNGDRGRDMHAKALSGDRDEQCAAQEHLNALVHAHKERDREYARHTAARDWDPDREGEWERQQRRVRAREKNVLMDPSSDPVDIVVQSSRQHHTSRT